MRCPPDQAYMHAPAGCTTCTKGGACSTRSQCLPTVCLPNQALLHVHYDHGVIRTDLAMREVRATILLFSLQILLHQLPPLCLAQLSQLHHVLLFKRASLAQLVGCATCPGGGPCSTGSKCVPTTSPPYQAHTDTLTTPRRREVAQQAIPLDYSKYLK